MKQIIFFALFFISITGFAQVKKVIVSKPVFPTTHSWTNVNDPVKLRKTCDSLYWISVNKSYQIGRLVYRIKIVMHNPKDVKFLGTWMARILEK